MSTDFEANDGGFTHTGTADEWERGLPAFAPITSAHSGANAWKTDLDNTYDISSNSDLMSPGIDLTGATGRITLNWWQKFQIESASFDNYWVEVRQVGQPATARKVFEWTGATMTRGVGNPAVTVQQSAGWGRVQADISSFAGQMVEVRFHLESDNTVVFAGVAIDDVSVTSCTQIAGAAPASPRRRHRRQQRVRARRDGGRGADAGGTTEPRSSRSPASSPTTPAPPAPRTRSPTTRVATARSPSAPPRRARTATASATRSPAARRRTGTAPRWKR